LLVLAEAACLGSAMAANEIGFLGSFASAISPESARGLPNKAETHGLRFSSRDCDYGLLRIASVLMNHDHYPDTTIRGILNTVKTVAMVGFSPKENRPSYFVFKYLLERGYRVLPVNPGQAGKEVLGQKIYASLSEIPEPIDMVDIFRASAFVMPVVQEALTLKPKPQVIWMQLTVRNDEAAALAEQAGIRVVMNRCPKIEYGRLSSEISWIGVNSRTLTSKRAQVLGKGVQRMGLSHGTMQGGATQATDRAQKSEDKSS
jgi:uncharacterized protein